MKAQASVEYLLLFTVSLVILIIIMQSMTYLSGMMNSYEKRSHSLIAKELFFSTARDICYIGEGSALIIQLSDRVEVKENRINNIPYYMPCSISEGNFSGMIVLQNRDGNITAVQVK